MPVPSLPAAPARGGRLRWAAAVVVAAVALAAYHRYLPGTFVMDDFGSVVDNPTIRQLWPPTWLTPPPEAGVGGRPFANFTLALDYARGGLDPWHYHATNLALHLAAALALGALMARTLRSPRLPADLRRAAGPLALVIATLWAVHPLTSSTVGYVAQRTELLLALGLLMLLYSFTCYSETRGGGWAAAALAAGALGMASKETMIVAPGLVWLYDRTFVSGSFRAAWRRHRGLHLALGAGGLAGLAVLAASEVAQRGAGFGQGVGAGTYALTASRAVLRYLQLSLWPHPLVFDYGWDFTREFSAAAPALLGCVVLVAATGIALCRWPPAGLAGAWWLLLLAPTSSFLPIVQQPIAENRAYLPLAGVIALAVIAAYRWMGLARPALLAGGCLVAGGFATLTAERGQVFQSEVALWRDTVARRPASARAHGQLAAALLRADRPEEGVAAARTALHLRPRYPDAQVNLGVALARTGRGPEAVPYYEAALRDQPDHPGAHYNLGLALAQGGHPAEAVAHFEAVLARVPHHAEASNNLAVVLLALGRAGESAAQARRAVRLDPTRAEAHYNLGNALVALGEIAAARAAFAEALRRQPDFARAHNNLGVLELRAGRPTAARARFEAALRAQPGYPEARRNLHALPPN